MGKTLIIHSDQTILNRYQAESTGNVVVANTMSQALKTINKSHETISSVIFSPYDSTLSPSRFIEAFLVQKPLAPIYIFEPTKNVSDLWLSEHHIQGAFTGREPLSELLSHLQYVQDPTLEEKLRSFVPSANYPKFTAVLAADLIGLRHAIFDLFIPNEKGEMVLVVAKGGEIEESLLRSLSQRSPWVYVLDESIAESRKNLHSLYESAVTNDALPDGWRIAETLYKNKAALYEMRKSGVSDTLVQQSLDSIQNVFLLLSHLKIEESGQKLKELIQIAKSCDKTVATTTLAILICKALKFEKSSVIEILGLAGMLQDLSLYQSPFGNLVDAQVNDLIPEAKAYYLQHPIYSADLVAKHTSVPEVVLQVIRQHHERKDKTGFPNHIGGIQLHPVAEVLSLINAYLDTQESEKQHLEQTLYPHYSDRIVQALKNII